MSRPPLTRAEVASVIERRSIAPRVPLLIHFWVMSPERFGARHPALEETLSRYPQDVQMLYLNIPDRFQAPPDDPSYRWFPFDDPYAGTEVALDQRIALPNWDAFDAVLAHFPSPEYPGLFRNCPAPDGRYRLGYWWYALFERHWSWRGMTDALLDYYAYPEQVHRLFRAVTDFYLRIMERAQAELGVDGIMISDDLGTQTSTFFSPAIFEQFFKPYYRELIEQAHRLGLHLWLHACGCMHQHLEQFVELGLDVIHPIQKYAMDYARTAQQLGGRISFWAGIDVQQVIPWGTPEEVRAEVRLLIDTFNRPEGGLILGAGNAIHEDCPIPNLEALLDEAYTYGTQAVARTRG